MGPAPFLFAALAVAEPPPATVPQPTEEVRRYHGRHFSAFEVSTFEGCWLSFTQEASDAFSRRYPEIEDPRSHLSGRVMVFELTFEGTRRVAPEGDYTNGFGHMGTYR